MMRARCCVVSKARGPPVPLENAAGLRAELDALKPLAVRKRAIDLEIDAAKIETAEDSGEPLAALIELIVEATARGRPGRAGVGTGPRAAERAALKQELEGLKLLALQRRAAAGGVEEEKMEEAMESGDPRAGLVAALLALHEAQRETQSETAG